MTNTYNDALEKAALIAESEDYHHDGEIWIVTQIAKKIRALKQEEAPETSDPRDALIKELMGALVAAQVAMSDGGIPSTPFVTDALSKIDVTLSKAKGVVDG